MSLIRQQVLEQIRSEIITCDIPPGTELRETELAEQYDVSKSPVREALQQLTFEGLIETRPRRGHRVTPISVADAGDILELRETLEVAAVRRSIDKADSEMLTVLEQYRDADTSSTSAFTRYNRKFHSALSELSGNKRLAADARRLMNSYDRLCVVSLSRVRADKGDFTGPLADHRQLIDAIQARDVRKAARLISRHIRTSQRYIMRGLASRPIVD